MNFNFVPMFLVTLIFLGVVSNNNSITISAAILLLMQQTALSQYIPFVEKHGLHDRIKAIGHRIAHGGEKYHESVLIDQDVLDELKACIPLAPLHNPANISGILAAQEHFPGLPNVGKSTLMNHLIGQKISITSKKAQTTRNRVTGIYTDDTAQFVFVDTPGFQTKHRNALNDRLNQNVTEALSGVDAVVFVVEAMRFTDADRIVMEQLPYKHARHPRYQQNRQKQSGQYWFAGIYRPNQRRIQICRA